MDNYIAGIFIKSVSREGHRSEITASSKRRTGCLIFGCLQGKSSSLRLLSKQGFVQQKRTIDETGNEECHLVWQAQ